MSRTPASRSHTSRSHTSPTSRSRATRSAEEIELEKLQLKEMFDPMFDNFKQVCRTREQLDYADKIYTDFEKIALSQISLDKKEKFVNRLIIALLKKRISFKKIGSFTINGGKSRRQKKSGNQKTRRRS